MFSEFLFEERISEQFGKYPSIKKVQEMTIEYAEVSPEKIKSWRRGAAWKAILPRLSVDYSRSIDENIEIYKSASTSYIVNGPREVDNDWGVDLSWDLSDLCLERISNNYRCTQ